MKFINLARSLFLLTFFAAGMNQSVQAPMSRGTFSTFLTLCNKLGIENKTLNYYFDINHNNEKFTDFIKTTYSLKTPNEIKLHILEQILILVTPQNRVGSRQQALIYQLNKKYDPAIEVYNAQQYSRMQSTRRKRYNTAAALVGLLTEWVDSEKQQPVKEDEELKNAAEPVDEDQLPYQVGIFSFDPDEEASWGSPSSTSMSLVTSRSSAGSQSLGRPSTTSPTSRETQEDCSPERETCFVEHESPTKPRVTYRRATGNQSSQPVDQDLLESTAQEEQRLTQKYNQAVQTYRVSTFDLAALLAASQSPDDES